MAEPVRNEKGEWVIPASRRPDGTWRAEKKMKEGYVPPEEVRAFATRANSGKPKGIPGLPPPAAGQQQSSGKKQSKTKKSKSNSQADNKTESIEAALERTSIANAGSSEPDASQAKAQQAPVEGNSEAPALESTPAVVDTSKKLKALRKKLRDINDIEYKQQNGSVLTPEQLEKLTKKAAFEAELADLESSNAATEQTTKVGTS